MDVRQLRQFIAVAELLSFSRAAERMKMTQPPLSFSIKQLETELGVELFLRHKKSLKLTSAGSVFLNESRRILSQLDHAATVTRQAGAGTVGNLRVAFVPSANYSCLVEVIQQFRQHFPNIELDLVESSSMNIVKLLEASQIDIGFLRPETGISEKLRTERIERDRFIAVLPTTHEYSDVNAINLKQLASDPFVAFSAIRSPTRSPTLYEQTLRLCRDAGFTPRIVQQAQQVQTIVNLVSAGLGVALVPGAVSRLSVPGVVYVPLRDRSPHMALELMVARRADDTSRQALAFAALAKKIGKTRGRKEG